MFPIASFAAAISSAVNCFSGARTIRLRTANAGRSTALSLGSSAATVAASVSPMYCVWSRSRLVTSKWLMSPQVPLPNRETNPSPSFLRSDSDK